MTRKRSTLHPATERALMTWAAQKGLIFMGAEGFAPQSVIEKIRRDREGAGEGKKSVQRWAEVYWGDGLAVHRITQSMAEIPRMVLTSYYLLRGPCFTPAADQATYIGIELRRYWTELEIGENVVESGLKLLQQQLRSADKTPA